MCQNDEKFFILTGDPGVGKTTLTIKIAGLISKTGVKTNGFYTEEVRNNRVRVGFDVVTFEGKRGCLARDQALLASPSKLQVGKYGVLIKDFEAIALPVISNESTNSDKQLLVIDEIGKMELLSNAFKDKMRTVFSSSSSYLVLATIPVRKGDQLIEGIRNNTQSRVWTITKENRNKIHEEILKEIQAVMQV